MKSKTVFRLLAVCVALLVCNYTYAVESNNKVVTTTEYASVSYYAGSFEDAKREAQRTGKGIFVKMWASWCVNCHVMDDHVFKDPKVATYYNENFVNLALDYDTKEGGDFARMHNVQFLPDFFFFDSNGNLVLRATEGKTQTQMLDFAKKASNASGSIVFQEVENIKVKNKIIAAKHLGTYKENTKIFESGYTKKEFLRNFAIQSKQLNKPYEEIAKKYIKKAKLSRENWSSVENHQFLLEFADVPELKSINILLQNKDAVAETYGRFNVESKFKHGIRNYVLEAASKGEKKKLRRSLKLIKKANLKNSKDFKHEVKLGFYEGSQSWKAYAKEINHYAKNFNGLDPIKLNIAAWNVHNNTQSKRLLRKAASWCKKSMEINTQYYNQETYAHILHKLGKKKQAERAVLRALILARQEGKTNTRADILAQEIDAVK